MRIASFLASATETACALGLDDQLVAISHECDWPPHVLDRPRVSRPVFDPTGLSSGEIDAAVRKAMVEHGRVYDLDVTVLTGAQPDLLLTQEVCEVCAVPTSLAHRAAAALDRMPKVLSLDAHRLEDILTSIHQVAQAAGVPERAVPVVAQLRARLDAVEQAVAGRPRPRVLALEWLDPAFVPGHWGPEMIALAGGHDLFGRAAVRSRELPWDELAGSDPDVLLVLPCGYDLARATVEADTHRARLITLAPRAIAAGRAWVMDASAYFNRSGPRVVDGVELLGAMLHPEAFPTVDLAGRAARWR
ncbi:MAG: ABC transporter substrate-binding protein [Gemmatimonadales bacterium]